MCNMPACDDSSTHYVWIRPLGVGPGGRPTVEARRLELCISHYKLALQLNADQLTKVDSHGPLNTGLRVVK